MSLEAMVQMQNQAQDGDYVLYNEEMIQDLGAGLLFSADLLVFLGDVGMMRGFYYLIQNMNARAVRGVSMHSVIGMCVSRTLHLINTLNTLHYVSSIIPNWLFFLMDTVNTVLAWYVLCVFILKRHTYDATKDRFG